MSTTRDAALTSGDATAGDGLTSGVTVDSVYRRFARPGWVLGHVLVLVAALVCLRLGLWQWHRVHEATGTIQNLGYTVLWPVFALAFIWMWLRFLKLETLKERAEDAEVADFAERMDADPELSGSKVEPVVERPRRPAATETVLTVATVDVEDEDDPQLTAYNRALAELAEQDRRAR